MIKKATYFLTFFLLVIELNAQQLLSPSYSFSRKKTSYITLIDGSEINGTIKDIDRKKGLIKFIKIKDGAGKKHKLKPEEVKFMYLPPNGLDKLNKASSFLIDAQKWNDENLIPKGKIVVEFGGKGNVQTIISQLRNSLKDKGYKEQSNLALWYFPSIGEYTTELESAGFRVLFAEHYDRPTELADKNSGIKDWISMFGESFFNGVEENDIEEIKNEVQEKVKEKCLIDGKWFADYKRIRVIAKK